MIDHRPYTTADELLWEQFVAESNNGTLFHTRKFLGYHPPERFKDYSLIFEKKGKPLALFPAAERVANGQRILWSHPGASYGSLVVPENLSFHDAMALAESLAKYGKQHGFDGIRLTLPPVIYNRRLSHYVDFALIHHGFTYVNREVSSILFLESTVEENLAKFKASHRRAVRKAEKSGVVIRKSEDYAAFYAILKKNLRIRHNVEPTHTLDELLKLRNLFPEKIRLFGAFLDDRMIAGVVNFICNQDVVLAFYISHDEDYADARPVNLLFYRIFEQAIHEGFRVFDFGIFTVHEEPNMGLARFKENFGASGMFRDTLQLTF